MNKLKIFLILAFLCIFLVACGDNETIEEKIDNQLIENHAEAQNNTEKEDEGECKKEVAQWEDENFEKMIRYYLNNFDKDIYVEDLNDITELHINSIYMVKTNIKKCEISDDYRKKLKLIESMNDIDNFNNLEKIELSCNKIKNIHIYKNSSNVTNLDLGLNIIENITNIKEYNNLTYLNISDNYINNLSILNTLPKLKELHLDNIGPKADNICGCITSDIDFDSIKELYSLETLTITHSNIKNINLLHECINLKNLSIIDCDITDEFIKQITELNKLEYLDLFGTSIPNTSNEYIDLSGLSNLDSLKKLVITKQHSNIGEISSLEELKTYYKDFSNEDLSGLINLKSLDIMFSDNLENIDFLKNIQSIEKLRIKNTNIKNIDGISFLLNLKDLEIIVGNISTINLNNTLLNLEKITIQSNKLDNIDFLSMCPNITYLNLSNNKIYNIDNLLSLKKLKEVNLENNDIINLNILDNFKNLKVTY